MAEAIKNPYQMNLITANKTKLYNPGTFWAFNTAKYRALLSNDPTVIKYWYRNESGLFFPDAYRVAEMARSYYFGDSSTENAEEFFGIIPMICANVAKMVAGSGYVFDETLNEVYIKRLQVILNDNEFDNGILIPSIIETIGLGDAAWHVHFDPELSDHPLIELVPPERLEIKRKCNRIIEYIVKQQAIVDNEPLPYELHTCYTKRRKKISYGDAVRYRDDGIMQRHKIWNGTKYLKTSRELKKKIFEAYGIEEKTVIPLVDFPVIYLPNTINVTQGVGIHENARPYGIVFGLDSVSSALDEILSNCVDTVRKCFPYLLIDPLMIPSDLHGNKDAASFSTRRHHFMLPRNAADAEKLLQMVQAKLNTTEFVESAKFQINIALNKVGINAATLGLQLSGHIESESTQNAKERNSIRTRNTIASDFERYLSKLFSVLLQYDDYVNGQEMATDLSTGETAIVAEEYHGITAKFNKYIVDTPEEVSTVIAKKVQACIMSTFLAVKEQHPDWDDESIYKEVNLILAEKTGQPIQMTDPDNPDIKPLLVQEDPEPDADADKPEKDDGGGDESDGSG